MGDSLMILNLPINYTERELKVRYRSLAQIYHPDKFSSTNTTMSKEEAQEHFKLVNNVYEYLRNLV